jgi:hypothetical protein
LPRDRGTQEQRVTARPARRVAAINADGSFLLRAERSGTGDGRVYHVDFAAQNAFGGACSGTLRVCVPHDMGNGSTCIDEGPLYDSTQ